MCTNCKELYGQNTDKLISHLWLHIECPGFSTFVIGKQRSYNSSPTGQWFCPPLLPTSNCPTSSLIITDVKYGHAKLVRTDMKETLIAKGRINGIFKDQSGRHEVHTKAVSWFSIMWQWKEHTLLREMNVALNSNCCLASWFCFLLPPIYPLCCC